jgi:hypothetical protein
MTILTSVSDVLALLASGVALLAAARALQAARRLAQPTQPAAATAQTPPATAKPSAPTASPARPAAHRRTTTSGTPTTTTATPATGNPPTTGDSGSRARGDALREQIRAWLAERPGQSLSLVEVSNGVGRRSATVAYALDKLISAGHVELTNPKPRRYAITGNGAHSVHSQPAPADIEATPELVAPERPAEPAATRAAAKPKTRTVAATATVESRRDGAGNGDLGEEIRAYLASQPGEHLSLIDVSHGVGRTSATVDYQLRRLVDAGQVTLASDRPRRYTIPAGQPSQSPDPGPAKPSGRQAAKGAAASPSSNARKPASRRGGRKAAAATGKIAATSR